jgi:hypothetical protein
VKVRALSLGVVSGLLAGVVIFGVGQASVPAGASPLPMAGISVGSQWTFELEAPYYPNGWTCEVQTFEKRAWEVNGGVVGSYRTSRSGTELRESVYGGDPHYTFKATYEESTTYFSGGSGPAYVGEYGHGRHTYPAELIPSVIAGC